MKNDLNELNSVLFDTLRGVKEGTMDTQKAVAISKVGASIINNAKTQLLAFKLVKGVKLNVEVLGGKVSDMHMPNPAASLGEGIVINKPKVSMSKKDLVTLKTEYAASLGFSTLGKALVSMSKMDFNTGFNEWQKDNG